MTPYLHHSPLFIWPVTSAHLRIIYFPLPLRILLSLGCWGFESVQGSACIPQGHIRHHGRLRAVRQENHLQQVRAGEERCGGVRTKEVKRKREKSMRKIKWRVEKWKEKKCIEENTNKEKYLNRYQTRSRRADDVTLYHVISAKALHGGVLMHRTAIDQRLSCIYHTSLSSTTLPCALFPSPTLISFL